MQLAPGTRVIIDQNPPRTAPYTICFANGCLADYEAGEELIGSMKNGQRLVVQAVNGQGQVLTLPLTYFSTAYDGLPSDAKGLDAQLRLLK